MMKELPGDVFVAGQLLPEHIEMLAGQGVMGFINNRPDNEIMGQPASDYMQSAAEGFGAAYAHIPMAGVLTPDLLARSAEAFAEMPRPIVAFCASGTRSAALWAFAHADKLGVDGVLQAIASVGYDLPQLRPQIEAYLARQNS